MEIKLIRDTYTDNSTIGKLFINGVFFCDTLEDKVRAIKIPKITAIPAGRYELAMTWSDHFQQVMPLLLNVLNYVGVRIHWGNYSTESDGCVLLGRRSAGMKDFIGQSRTTYATFISKLKTAAKGEKI